MPLYPILPSSSEDNNASTPTTTKMSLGIEICKDMLIKFDGNKAKLYEFIDNCDKANEVVKSEQKDILFKLIETKWTDNARAIVRNRSFSDWAELKFFSILLKEQALNVFISGLTRDLSILVKSQKPNSLEDAIAIAQSEEQQLKSKTETSKYHGFKYSSVCNKPGHNYNCRFNNANNVKRRNELSNIRHTNNKPTPIPNSSNFRQTVNSNNFRQVAKICNYCKNKGHLINECRKRQYNNQRREQSQTSNSVRNSHSQQSQNFNQNFQNLSLNEQVPRDQAATSRNAHTVNAAYQQ